MLEVILDLYRRIASEIFYLDPLPLELAAAAPPRPVRTLHSSAVILELERTTRVDGANWPHIGRNNYCGHASVWFTVGAYSV